MSGDLDGNEMPPAIEFYLKDPARLAALARTGLVDSEAEPSYDRLTRLAAKFLGTPVSLISLVDDRRQFFKSCLGLPSPWNEDRQTPLSHSFCQHVIASREPLVIQDARLDPLVRESLAITDLSVVAYLGIPLVIEGHVIGSFCAIDTQPRNWTVENVEVLRDLAESVVTEIRLRQENREMVRQRSLAEEAHRVVLQAEERNQTLLELMQEGFCIIEMIHDLNKKPVDYRFLEVNPAFEQHTGMHEATGKTIREFAPNLEEFWFDRYDEVARTGQSVRFIDSTRSLDGRCFEVQAFRVGEADQERVAIFFRDITAQTRAEEDRAGLVRQLREADERKDEFLAMLAHELRNPLGAISSGLQLVQATQKPEILTQIRDMIQRQVDHLTRLIDDLLDVSRISQGKIALKTTTVELSAIVARAVELVQPIVVQKRHALTVKVPEISVPFVADPTRTAQILGNLLTNAAKYTEPGGKIHLEARLEGNEVVFSIQDSGVGISEEMLPKVFGLFTQVDATIDRSQGGLGIGLTLVKTLVEMHGGTVAAQSQGKGQGSEFKVRIPVGQPEVLEKVAPVSDTKPRTGSGRVLVVDDNRDTARLTARMLKFAGFEVATAHDGTEAIEAARKFLPAVVLLDIGLPGMNGYDVASILREDSLCKSAILIAVSGYGEEKSRERSKAAGFDHHLTKPLDFGQLMAMIGT